MRTRAVLGSIFASVAVLVVGWQAGAAVVVTSTATTSAPQASRVTPAPVVGGTPAPAATPTAVPVPAGPADGTYTGTSVDTRYGSVQVSIALTSGAITDVAALKLTDADGRSVQISNRAAPLLHDEVLASQSANVSNVTGATYTTKAYLSSVQSALDQAGF